MMMSRCVSTVCTVVIILTVSAYVNGLDNYRERCTITEGVGVTVDSCDGSKFLACKSGHCDCLDTVNQIYTFRHESEKRQKRGIGKKVAIGAGGAFVGYELAKATSSGSGGLHSSPNRENSSSKKKVFSCYGRVGAPCALNYNNVNVVTTANSSTTTTTTTHDGLTNPNHEGNLTNTSSTTTAAPMVVIDLHKLAGCVQYAICKPQIFGGDNTTSVRIISSDPRVGMCMCDTGYSRSTTDMCEKSSKESLMSSMFIIAITSTFLTILY